MGFESFINCLIITNNNKYIVNTFLWEVTRTSLCLFSWDFVNLHDDEAVVVVVVVDDVLVLELDDDDVVDDEQQGQ